MDGLPIRGVTWIVVFMILNALTEAMITAFESISEPGVEKRAEDGDKKAQKVFYILEHHRRYITVTDFIRIVCVSGIAVAYITCILGELHEAVAQYIVEQPVLSRLLAGVVTVVAVMLVELFAIKLPKKLAFRHAERFAYVSEGLLKLLMVVFGPFAWVVEGITAAILKLFHIKASELEEVVTEEELISTVAEAQENGVLEAEEAEMIHNIFEFDAKDVSDIMTHRKNIVAINGDMSLLDAMKFMKDAPYSRFPVYEDTVEQIIGILHMKDVTRMYFSGNPEKMKNRKVRNAARKPLYVPDTQSLDDLFHLMQKKKNHIAIAIDEYGQTAGLITMEDILEEIVGDIQDEYDTEEEDIIVEQDGTYLVSGATTLADLSDVLDIELEDEDYDTLNGLLVSELGHIPSEADRSTIYYKGLQIDILEISSRMITLARVTKLPEEEASVEEEKEE